MPGRLSRLIVALAAIWCCGCTPSAWYRLPQQYDASAALEREWLVQAVRFDGSPAEHSGSVLFGVSGGDRETPWRWTHRKAGFRFWPVTAVQSSLTIDLSVADATLSQTGPIAVTVSVNDKTIAVETFAKSGSYLLRYPIEVRGLPSDKPLDVTLETEPPWISPSDHNDLGVILRSVVLTFDRAAEKK